MKHNDFSRNRPADKGRNNDPQIRDYTGPQPGMNTVSSSAKDKENENLSETAKDGFHEERPGPSADMNLVEPANEADEEKSY